MSAYIHAIGTAVPEYRIDQQKTVEFMINALELDEREARKLRVLYRATGIQSRYSVIPDYGSEVDDFSFYPKKKDLEPFPSIHPRMKLYEKSALSLAENAIVDLNISSQQLKSATHLITVSCTGMYAPGLDIQLVQQLGLASDIQRTAINFMGCYAAFNAIKAADAICARDEKANVLVLCLELCTIHFQKSAEEDHLLSGALFSDGAAALWMSNQVPKKGMYLEAKRFYCDLFLGGKQEMAWHIGDHGFEMRLTSYVPALIQKGISELTHKLLEGHHIKRHEIEHYAIHPGGKRILEVIEEELELSKEDNRAAYEVLSNYGNMSSPTVLFVLKNIFDRLENENNGEHILSFAFGPGLTLESMLLEIRHE